MMGPLLETLAENVSYPTLFLAASAVIIYFVYTQWSTLPHGPVGIPYFGYYPYLTDDFALELGELAKKYGDVFCFRVTGQLYVHLNSLRAMREVFITKSECFAGRSMSFTIFREFFNDGIFFVNGEPWKVLRKFFVKTLKEFGMGKDVQERIVMDRVQHVLNDLKHSDGKKVNVLQLFTENSSCVIRQILFSSGKIDDEDCRLLNDAYLKMGSLFNSVDALLAGPISQYLIFPFMKSYKAAMAGKATMETILYKIIKQHEDSFDKHHLKNLIDYYINERRNLQEKGDPKADIFTNSCLVYTMIQLFGDGGFAVGLLISEAFNELVKYPDIQRKIQAEIDEVVGRERLPNCGDRSRLQYTSAALYEAQRVSDFLKTLTSLKCTKETVIQGQRVPQGAITLMNFWSAHHDPEIYEDPYTFDPSRFMPTKDQKTKVELPILFGVGKRACVGESLSNMQALLFVVAILQNFNIHPAEENSIPKVDYDEWKLEIIFTPRTT